MAFIRTWLLGLTLRSDTSKEDSEQNFIILIDCALNCTWWYSATGLKGGSRGWFAANGALRLVVVQFDYSPGLSMLIYPKMTSVPQPPSPIPSPGQRVKRKEEKRRKRERKKQGYHFRTPSPQYKFLVTPLDDFINHCEVESQSPMLQSVQLQSDCKLRCFKQSNSKAIEISYASSSSTPERLKSSMLQAVLP